MEKRNFQMKNKSNLVKIVNSIEELVLTVILISFSYLIPKNKKLILFGSEDGNVFNGNPKYLYLYLMYNPLEEIKPVWLSNSREILLRLNAKKMPAEVKKSFKGIWSILRAKYFVIDHLISDFSFIGMNFGRFNIIQTWHGTGFKEIGLRGVMNKTFRQKVHRFVLKSEFKKYCLITSNSLSDQERKKKCFNNPNIIITGSPRNDVFFDTEARKAFRANLKIPENKAVILYAPTFRDNQTFSPFSDKFWIKLQKLLKERNSVFLIKRHPLDRAFSIPRGYKNIIDITPETSDVQEILVITDILISDYSGIVTDFALTKKPIIFYTYDYEEYTKNCRNFYYNLKETLPGPFASNEDELLDHIFNFGWFNKKSYRLKYNKFINKFHKYKDGKSCERVLNTILELGK